MNTIILDDIIRIVKTFNRIGISVSGGFDSALLSYLIFETRAELGTDNIVEFFTVPRYDDSVIHAKRIIDFIDGRFNIGAYSTHTIVGNPDIHHSLQVDSGLREMLACDRLDIILAGENIVPPEDEVPGGPIRYRGKPAKLYKPFFDYTKDVIIQLAIDKNLTEVMELSHTCTESKMYRCGNCWQCKERAWAFRQCNYTDPGTM